MLLVGAAHGVLIEVKVGANATIPHTELNLFTMRENLWYYFLLKFMCASTSCFVFKNQIYKIMQNYAELSKPWAYKP